tara:strand:+ start:408 stop:644 length:237 start_codon:yes stop_codon:yes gene_type:complete
MKDPDIIAIYWHISDVRLVAPSLQDFQCRFILQQLKAKHDVNVGINLDTIYAQVKENYPSAVMFDNQFNSIFGVPEND